MKVALVIDDDKRTRNSLKPFLEFKGFIVRCCENMTSACDGLKQVYFDIVLIDYYMPEMNGADITKMMRNYCQDTFIVGMSLENKEREFLDAGANVFICKDRLIHGLASLIDTRSNLVKSNRLMAVKRPRLNKPS